MNRRGFGVCLISLSLGHVGLSQPIFVPQQKLRPFDQSSQAPDCLEFKGRFLRAVQQRDAKWILNVSNNTCRLNPNKAGSWNRLERYLKNGGAWDTLIDQDGVSKEVLVFPSFEKIFPKELVSNYAVVAGEGVAFRSEPNTNSRVICRLSYDIIKWLKHEDGWYRCHLPVGAPDRYGWIKDEFLYFPNVSPLYFMQQNGRWQIQYSPPWHEMYDSSKPSRC